MKEVSAIILAGGKNSRMQGEDKAFLEIDGKPFIARIIGALKGLVVEIIVVTNNPERYTTTEVLNTLSLRGVRRRRTTKQSYIRIASRFAARNDFVKRLNALVLVKDESFDKGPLMGIYSGLKASSTKYNFVVACDMPFIKPALIKFMLDKKKGYDILLIRDSEKFHTLFGVYSKECIPVMEEMIKSGELRVRSIFPKLNAHFIFKDDIGKFDPDLLSLVNVNTAQELEKIGGRK